VLARSPVDDSSNAGAGRHDAQVYGEPALPSDGTTRLDGSARPAAGFPYGISTTVPTLLRSWRTTRKPAARASISSSPSKNRCS